MKASRTSQDGRLHWQANRSTRDRSGRPWRATVETLEERRHFAVLVDGPQPDGDLMILGDAANNNITVSLDADNWLTVDPVDPANPGPFNPNMVTTIKIGTNEGNDIVTVSARITKDTDLAQVGRACDLAVLNGNHGTTCAMLLAGKPILQVPRTLEQAITAGAVARLGAGESVGSRDDADAVRAALDRMLAGDGYAQAAAAFAARYADFDPQRQRAAMAARVEQLLPAWPDGKTKLQPHAPQRTESATF